MYWPGGEGRLDNFLDADYIIVSYSPRCSDLIELRPYHYKANGILPEFLVVDVSL